MVEIYRRTLEPHQLLEGYIDNINMIIFRQSLVAVVADGGIVKYLRRVGWGAIEPREKRVQLKTPVKYVIISHTALLGRCTTTDDCCRDARKVQKFNMEKSREWSHSPT